MGEPRVSAAAGISVAKVSGGIGDAGISVAKVSGGIGDVEISTAQASSGVSAENNLQHAQFKRGRECVARFHNGGAAVAQCADRSGHGFKTNKVGACWRIDLHKRIAV